MSSRWLKGVHQGSCKALQSAKQGSWCQAGALSHAGGMAQEAGAPVSLTGMTQSPQNPEARESRTGTGVRPWLPHQQAWTFSPEIQSRSNWEKTQAPLSKSPEAIASPSPHHHLPPPAKPGPKTEETWLFPVVHTWSSQQEATRHGQSPGAHPALGNIPTSCPCSRQWIQQCEHGEGRKVG